MDRWAPRGPNEPWDTPRDGTLYDTTTTKANPVLPAAGQAAAGLGGVRAALTHGTQHTVRNQQRCRTRLPAAGVGSVQP